MPNLMEFNEENFGQISQGTINNLTATSQKGPTRKEIDSEEYIKDLRVITKKKLEFEDTLKKIILSSQVMSDVIKGTFAMRNKKQMKKM